MKGQSENRDLKKKFADFTYPVNDANWDAISARLHAGSGSGFLGDKFSNSTIQPSAAAWSNISAVIQPAHRRRPVAWWFAAAASFALLMYVGYTVFYPVGNRSELAQEKTTKEQQIESGKPADADKMLSGKNSSNTISDSSPATNTTIRDADAKKEKQTKDIGTKTENDALPPTEPGNPLIANRETVPGDENRTIAIVHVPEEENPENTNFSERAVAMIKMAQRNPQIHRHFAEGVLIAQKSDIAFAKEKIEEKHKKNTGFYDGTETSPPRDFSLWAGSQFALASSIVENNSDRSENFQSGNNSPAAGIALNNNYSPPIYYGVNGEIKFWNRTSVGVGLGYLRMQSGTSYYFGNDEQVVEEKSYNYLSVPVYLKFNFIEKPKFAAYTSLGHAFDLMVGQKVLSETFQNSQLTQSSTDRNVNQGNQANMYMGLGTNFKFNKYLGIFAEASLMNYYFMSNDNFYSQQNYWPALRFGLLISFE